MTQKELEEKIRLSNVPDHFYSLNDGLKSNAYILYKNYAKWEFFYLDERGGRNTFKEFTNDEEAFDFLWTMLEKEMKYPPSIPPKTVGR
jgi:hypothetical protein